MNRKKIAVSLFVILLIINCFAPHAFAEVKLPDGAVQGLPEKLAAMDSSGNSVNSETGEYFFHAENMTFGEVYTKDVQLINLRSDQAYHIYFYVEPLPETKKGNLDLEESCICSFYLDGEQFYQGSVTGVGNIDLTKTVKDLGYYAPGNSHTLTCSVAWVNTSGEYFIDEGHKLTDHTGTWTLTPKEGNNKISGEIEFKWIFSAAVDEDYIPPDTGLFTADGSILLACIIVVAVMIAVMLILLAKKKRKKEKS